MADYIPTKDADFDIWFKNLTQYIGAKITGSNPVWTHISQTELTKLTAAYAVWYAAYSAILTPHSEVETTAKNNARYAAEQVIRPFKRRYLDDPPVLDEDRVALSIRLHDTHPTRSPVPHDQPAAQVENTRNRFEHTVRAINPLTGDLSKPAGVHGVRTGWQVGGVKPAAGADLPRSRFSQKTTAIITHTEADKAQPVFYAACYENARGEQGPWSLVEEAVIG